jgi:VIT1/CCC1 family predicted Fe2+/Mn2+ transporter
MNWLDLADLSHEERRAERERRQQDLAPGLSDQEVEQIARAGWLEEQEQAIEGAYELPVALYEW